MVAELLFLLLPLAAFSGWWLGRRGGGSARAGEGRELPRDYFRGLTYLLNEQPDKAIEVFVRMVELDSDTVELHLALAQLFRRRGEVDRAIRIHQNLIARPVLNPEHREQALFELGCDYMRAGLLDRAENLFLDLIDNPAVGAAALRQLLDIFQQIKEWERAIDMARRLQAATREPLGPMVAHFHCELAELALAEGQAQTAAAHVRKALAEDKGSSRANLLEGRLAMMAGNWRAAIKSLAEVSRQDPAFLAETIEPLRECYQALGRPDELEEFLRALFEKTRSNSAALALAELRRRSEGERPVLAFLTEHVKASPSLKGMEQILELKAADPQPPTQADLQDLRAVVAGILRGRPTYKCRHCGFPAKRLHWVCPSCKQWNTVRPLDGGGE